MGEVANVKDEDNRKSEKNVVRCMGASLIAFAQRCEARSLVGTDPLGGVRKIYPGAPILGLLSCMCGPSKSQPCDGSHKATRDEEEGKTYEYDAQGHGREV